MSELKSSFGRASLGLIPVETNLILGRTLDPMGKRLHQLLGGLQDFQAHVAVESTERVLGERKRLHTGFKDVPKVGTIRARREGVYPPFGYVWLEV